MTSEWHCEEDFEKDIWAFSEIKAEPEAILEELPSVQEWKARVGANNNSSIFESQFPTEDVTYVSSGRGRGGISKYYRPGAPVRDVGLAEEDDIKKRLRMASGLGYSNELIESTFRKRIGKPEKDGINEATMFCDYPELFYQMEPATVNDSRIQPPHIPSSPSKISARIGTPDLTTVESAAPAESGIGSLPESKPALLEESDKNTTNHKVAAPLPLSVLRSRARKKSADTNAKKRPPSSEKENAAVVKETPKISSGSPSLSWERSNSNSPRGRACSKSPTDDSSANDSNKRPLVPNITTSDSTTIARSDSVNNWRGSSNETNGSTDSICTNEYWWRTAAFESSGSSDESLSWRRRDTKSPPRFFGNHWIHNGRSARAFDINSDDDFPAL